MPRQNNPPPQIEEDGSDLWNDKEYQSFTPKFLERVPHLRGFKEYGSVAQTFASRELGFFVFNNDNDIAERAMLKQLMLGRRGKKVTSRSENQELAETDFENYLKSTSANKLEIIGNKFFVKVNNFYECLVPSQNSGIIKREKGKDAPLEKLYSIPGKLFPKHFGDFDYSEVQGISLDFKHKLNRSSIYLLNKEGYRLTQFDCEQRLDMRHYLLHPNVFFGEIELCDNVIILEAIRGKISKRDVFTHYIILDYPNIKCLYHIQIMKTAVNIKKPTIGECFFYLTQGNTVEVYDFKKMISEAEKLDVDKDCPKDSEYICPINLRISKSPELLFKVVAHQGIMDIVDYTPPFFTRQTSKGVFRVTEVKPNGLDLKIEGTQISDLELTNSNPLSEDFLASITDKNQLIFIGDDSFSIFEVDFHSKPEPFIREIVRKVYCPQKIDIGTPINGVRRTSRSVKRINYGSNEIEQTYKYCYNTLLDQTAICHIVTKDGYLHMQIYIYENNPWHLFTKIQLNPIKNIYNNMDNTKLSSDLTFANTFIAIKRKADESYELFVIPLLIESRLD